MKKAIISYTAAGIFGLVFTILFFRDEWLAAFDAILVGFIVLGFDSLFIIMLIRRIRREIKSKK